ncbi:MAG: iron chelate uptake ABC transporter family permease subunit, partial [bacterium]
MNTTTGSPQAAIAPRGLATASGLALMLAAASVLLLLAGLAAGSDGWSLAWADEWTLLRDIRAPRSIGAWLAGALLGFAGAVAQGLFRN